MAKQILGVVVNRSKVDIPFEVIMAALDTTYFSLQNSYFNEYFSRFCSQPFMTSKSSPYKLNLIFKVFII